MRRILRGKGLRRAAWATGLVGLAAAACAHEERAVPSTPRPPPADAAAIVFDEAPRPPPYLLADPPIRGAAPPFVSLGKVGMGVIQDGMRVVVSPDGLRAARDVADAPLVSGERVPAWLGGGFLFRTQTALYVSDAYDGALRPVVAFRDSVAQISFGPKSALVRTSDGERFAVDLAPGAGARAPIAPFGMADVAAVPDGRAAAITEGGGLLVSADFGAHWSDMSAQLGARADRVAVIEDALWVADASGRAARVESGGRLSAFAKLPPVKPLELRPKDPRWHGDDTPLRRALHVGVAMDDGTAVVAGGGDVAHVSLSTGEIVSLAPGRLPPGAACEAVRAQDDVVFVCTRSAGPSFVATRALGDKAPTIEQTFAAPGQFYASDEGAIAFGGPCTRPKGSKSVACVRGAAGGWQEIDLGGRLGDGGTSVDVARWIPRADGTAVAFTTAPVEGLVDGRTGEARAWPGDAMTPALKAALGDGRPRAKDTSRMVDRTWSMTPLGALRGWTDGGAIEIGADGAPSVSPFTFDRMATAGPFAYARTRDGRAWQTLDRGANWIEIAAPVSARSPASIEVRGCSSAGCDLGPWYRVGWTPAAVQASAPPIVAPPPPRLSLPPLRPLVCSIAGETRTGAIPRSDRSPEDLDLGLSRVAVQEGVEMQRLLFARGAPNPVHGGGDSIDADNGAARAIAHGYAAEAGDDRLRVQGPNPDPMALRRSLAFVPAFEPTAPVRRGSFVMSDLLASARAIGMSARDLTREDFTTVTGVVPVTPIDPGAAADLAILGSNGLLGLFRASPRARDRVVLHRRDFDDAAPTSAVATGADSIALLEAGSDGQERVLTLDGAGAAVLFDVPPPARRAFYPANVDVLAVGPNRELATIRTASGSEPPSTLDPALLTVPGSAPVALAPWSTLLTADDPACRADGAGWRATLQTIAPWLRVEGAVAPYEENAPMVARVRWSESRVCLEAIELRLTDTAAKLPSRPATGAKPRGDADPLVVMDAAIETWLIVRFVPSPIAARAAVAPGFEERQPLTCALAPR